MSDTAEMYAALKELDKQRRADLATAAAADFSAACELAVQHGLILKRHTDWHYTLQAKGGWLVNLYPSKHRICFSKDRRGPFLKVSPDWTLLEVVIAAIEVRKGESNA